MHALASASPDSLGASPSLLDWPSAAYGVNAMRDSAAWAEDGGAGRPTAGVLTAATGPLDAAAVHADRPAQQQIRRKRLDRARIFISSERPWFTRAATPSAGWSAPRAAPDRRRPGSRPRCRSAARAA